MTDAAKPLAGVKAAVFDAYGTLFDVNAAVQRYAEAVGPDAAHLSEVWRNKQLEYSWTLSLMGQYAAFWDLTVRALDYALAIHPNVDPGLRERLLDAYRDLEAYPEVPGVLAALRKRGVEVTVEDKTPGELKITPNHHYNGTFVEPWGEPSQRGYGIEILRRFFEEVAFVEFGGTTEARRERLEAMRALTYNDLSADRNTVATVQALEAILARHAAGQPGCVVTVNGRHEGLVLHAPGQAEPVVLYPERV